jgi:hypothetical protein
VRPIDLAKTAKTKIGSKTDHNVSSHLKYSTKIDHHEFSVENYQYYKKIVPPRRKRILMNWCIKNIRPKQYGAAHKMRGLKLTNEDGPEEAQPNLNHVDISLAHKRVQPTLNRRVAQQKT